MRLLVSVRSAAEARAALAGGAEIIDAKEPALGALGPVSPADLRMIVLEVPAMQPFSAALGDPSDADSVARAIRSLDALGPRPGETYVKLGLGALRGEGAAGNVVAAAIKAAARSALRPAVILVAYADHAAARSPHRDRVSALAVEVGARGVLLDTYLKDGRDLFDHADEDELHAWTAHARGAGLLVALAGSLAEAGIGRAARLQPDIVGVRGAACDGGREGFVSAERVRRLGRRLAGEGSSADLTEAAQPGEDSRTAKPIIS